MSVFRIRYIEDNISIAKKLEFFNRIGRLSPLDDGIWASVLSKEDSRKTPVGGNLRPNADSLNLAVKGNLRLKIINYRLQYIRISNTIPASCISGLGNNLNIEVILMILKIMAPVIIVSSLVLASCGGGGGGSGSSDDEGITYTGSKSPASVNAGNAEELAIASAGGANQAIAADTANSANPISPRGSAAPRGNAANLNLIPKIVEQLEILAISESRTAQQLLPICDTGTADLDQNNNGTEGTIEFMNCLVTGGNGAIVNGKVEFDSTISGSTITSLNMRFINFRVTHLGETQTVYMTVSCSGAPLTCNLFSDYVGFDGRVYRVEITVVTNTAATSFDVDATVFDPDHGFFTIDASVTYNNCPGSVPETGTLTITGDAATTASVVFNDCDSFTVTHLGVPTVYMWADIL